MFRTPTQRNFKKQMKEIEKSKGKKRDIYGESKKTVKFSSPVYRQNSFSRPLAIIITLLLFIGPYFLSGQGIKLNVPSFRQNRINLTSDEKPMSKKYAFFLQKLDQLDSSLDEVNKKINIFHQMNYNQMDKKLYMETLLDGITITQDCSTKLAKTKPIDIFQSLYELKSDIYNNKNLAFKHYLNYANNNNKSDLDIANKYNQLSVANNEKYQDELLKVLKEQKFKHEVHEDGRIRYWYSEI